MIQPSNRTQSSELVSILLPVYNAGETLADCLDSLLKQTYQPLEIIAIDDFSRDNSFQILRKYHKLDKRLKIYRNVKHYDMTITLNRCLKAAKGKYLTFMDSKDISTPDRIKKQVQYLQENDRTVAIGTQCIFIDENKKKVGKSEFPQEHEAIYARLVNGLTIQFETALINTYLLPKDLLRFYKTSSPLLYSDLFVKLQKYGSFANLNHCLYLKLKQSQNQLENAKKYILPHLKLFIKARFTHDYKPSFTSLLSPLIK